MHSGSPAVVPLAIGLAVAQEARAGLVQRLPALGALEAGDVPLQVRRHPQQEGVLDAAPAARAQGQPRPPCREQAGHSQGQRCARNSPGIRERHFFLIFYFFFPFSYFFFFLAK